jgi:hypothetical protein
MPDIDLKRLRELRRRAEELSATLASDLKPFRHPQPYNGFCRKPDSPTEDPKDVNVTTTCSCLMSLALSDKLEEFYGKDSKEIVVSTFEKLVEAPWMSSGLAENNAFTTTLVIRLFGFLVKAGLPVAGTKTALKLWEPCLTFSNFPLFAKKLCRKSPDPFSKYLFERFSTTLQNHLRSFILSGRDGKQIENQTAGELSRLVLTSSLFDIRWFKKVHLSSEAHKLLKGPTDAYRIALLNNILLHDFYSGALTPLRRKSFRDIILDLSSHPEWFGINDYPPAAAVLYWFVDGITHADIALPPKDWDVLCTWATDEFGKQRSLAVSKHAAMMDPVAMAMAACLCARLLTISNALKLGMTKKHHAILPSSVELERSIVDLFTEQTPSGIWPKYFPLFHYQDAGSNFCFTFELLEAVLTEFGGKQSHLLTEEVVIIGLERAVTWCETNRLRCSERKLRDTVPFNGWNSGGNLETLHRRQPESWATAVVHMFLREMIDVLSNHIQFTLLKNYGARTPTEKWKKIKNLVDIEIWFDKGPRSLKQILSDTIVGTFKDFGGSKSDKLRKRSVKNAPLSALLFGPPGTSKTEVAKGVAADLNWPLVEIDPSHFLQEGFQNIYTQAEKIFLDVMDMAGVVVLFDEMDALVQKRDAETSIEIESKFLTTYMLPKLAKLHDRGQLAFLMATNFQASFDDAIKREGRFDFLLCMGPPTLRAKCDSIHVFFELDDETEETKKAGKSMWNRAAADGWLAGQLTLYTFGEFKSFITSIGGAESIGAKVEALTDAEFLKIVKVHSVSLKFDDLAVLKTIPELSKWKRLRDLDRLTFDERGLENAKIDTKIPVIKYLLDKKQSRRQCVELPRNAKRGK